MNLLYNLFQLKMTSQINTEVNLQSYKINKVNLQRNLIVFFN